MSFTPTMPHITPVPRAHIRKTAPLRFGNAKPENQSQPLDTVEIARKAVPATVALEIVWPSDSLPEGRISKLLAKIVPPPPKELREYASGFWLHTSQGPVVITNAHAVKPLSSKSQANKTPQSILARLNKISTHINARCNLKPATLELVLAERPNASSRMAIDSDLDIAVLKPLPSEDAEKYSHIQPLNPEADMDSVEAGERVLAVVQDGKYQPLPILLIGIISGFRLGATGKEPFVDVGTTLVTKGGNSGSPVLRLRNGKTIGVFKSSNEYSRSWATSIADVMRKLEEWGF
jgi:hypothetical protein